MTIMASVVTKSVKGLARILCRVDDAALAKVPDHGPLILVVNHVNFLDAPVIYSHLFPRPLTGFTKVETWDNPFLGFLFSTWGAIPIKRGTIDREAFRAGFKALEQGKILAIAPEGTRSGTGQLQEGRAGIIHIAQRSSALLMPMVYYGGENFWANIKRLRRTDFHIIVGEPFHLVNTEKLVSKEERQQIMNEIMYQLAVLLPPQYRGIYSDLDKATHVHLRFEEKTAETANKKVRLSSLPNC